MVDSVSALGRKFGNEARKVVARREAVSNEENLRSSSALHFAAHVSLGLLLFT
jgi:hypothetical protein